MRTSYLHRFLGTKNYRRTILRFCRAIKASGLNFDAIAYRGQSGALIAAPVALFLKKHLILVRKEDECSHSSYSVEGCTKNYCRYIIVDDLISCGNTVQHIYSKVADKLYFPDLVAVFVCSGHPADIRYAIGVNEWDFPIHCLSQRRIYRQRKKQNSIEFEKFPR